MKKYNKIFIIIIVVWIAFILIDCNRINNSGNSLKPLITIWTREYEDKSEYVTEYIGLGYSVRHYRTKNTAAYGTIVKLFYIFPLERFNAE